MDSETSDLKEPSGELSVNGRTFYVLSFLQILPVHLHCTGLEPMTRQNRVNVRVFDLRELSRHS